MKIENKCICEHSTGSTHIECCNICGLPLQKEQWYFYLPDENSNQVQAGVMPKIADLVDKFLTWELPKSVCSDLRVTENNYNTKRTGTNLLTADEAKQRLEYLLSNFSA